MTSPAHPSPHAPTSLPHYVCAQVDSKAAIEPPSTSLPGPHESSGNHASAAVQQPRNEVGSVLGAGLFPAAGTTAAWLLRASQLSATGAGVLNPDAVMVDAHDGSAAGEGVVFRLFPALGMEGSAAGQGMRGNPRSAVKRPRTAQGNTWM